MKTIKVVTHLIGPVTEHRQHTAILQSDSGTQLVHSVNWSWVIEWLYYSFAITALFSRSRKPLIPTLHDTIVTAMEIQILVNACAYTVTPCGSDRYFIDSDNASFIIAKNGKTWVCADLVPAPLIKLLGSEIDRMATSFS